MLFVLKLLVWFIAGYVGLILVTKSIGEYKVPWPFVVLGTAAGLVFFIVGLVIYVAFYDYETLPRWNVKFWERK